MARSLLLMALLVAAPGCLIHLAPGEGDESSCPPPEPPATIEDGTYGSSVQRVDSVAAYPSFRSDYPKALAFDRDARTVRISYLHEDKRVVENWAVTSLVTPSVGACSRTGHEQAE